MGAGGMEVVYIDPITKTASWALTPIWPIPPVRVRVRGPRANSTADQHSNRNLPYVLVPAALGRGDVQAAPPGSSIAR
jgi:hypothetical protein